MKFYYWVMVLLFSFIGIFTPAAAESLDLKKTGNDLLMPMVQNGLWGYIDRTSRIRRTISSVTFEIRCGF